MNHQPMVVLARGQWPESEDDELPPLAGFTASSFNPLVAEAAERCLRARYGPAPGPEPTRTALLLASGSGDRATASAIDAAAASRRRVPPLLFFQSNPNAVLGHVAARWRLTGPVVATSPTTQPGPDGVPPDALELAALLLADGDADQVLVIAAEQALPGERDHAVALLLKQP
jgi:3-oxoacyl-(acyl-carrier-protein) synthase